MGKKRAWIIVFLVLAIVLSLISIAVSIAVSNSEAKVSAVEHGTIQLTVEPRGGNISNGGYYEKER